jgi:hypothetical protein
LKKNLDFLNFGSQVKQWVRTFYNEIFSCVSLNGGYSSWFKLNRGVRQGDPLSPYLYLLCAEILSKMLRENKKIRGIGLRDQDVLLSQFADDTALYLDGSEESFVEAVRMLTRFADVSGLRINYEKTQVVWMGSRKNCHVRFLRDKNFCWDPGIFKYLGISFSINTDDIVNINFDGKLKEIEKLLFFWSKRQLTPFGKIIVLKTLAVSKLTYLFVNLPDPNEVFLKELDNIFYRFLWNSKQCKVSKACICQPYENGGLRMLNVFAFLSSMKLSWLRRLSSLSMLSLNDFTFNLYPGLEKLAIYGGEYVKTLKRTIKNPFWQDVLKHLERLQARCPPTDINEFNAECLFFNCNITVGGQIVCNKNWIEAGIYQICNLLDDEGLYMSFESFKAKYNNLKVNFLQYRGIIDAVRNYQRELKIIQEPNFKFLEPNAVKFIKEGNKTIYYKMVLTDSLPCGIRKWNNIFAQLNWKNILHVCHKTTRDCQLKWFQLRLIYRILPTNRYLFFRKVVDSQACSFCGSENETIVHLLWHCRYVENFWKEFEDLLIRNCECMLHFHFNEELVLFGVSEHIYTDNVLDLIILLAKYYIYQCKLKCVKPSVTFFFVHS